MKTYVDSKVKLIDGTEYDLAFYTWLKSRKHVIKLPNGNKIDDVEIDGKCDSCLYFDDDYSIMFKSDDVMYLLVPKIKYDMSSEYRQKHMIHDFYVDNELVEYDEYRKRIVDILNLQFNNFPQYTFEITGSALFRDLLYNVNWSEMWSVSNRFLFSTLRDDEVIEESNYHISSEYKDIPEWESQFDTYMDKIKETNITDDNRTEMPYSITSEFWWGCNHKTLISVLSMMKLKFPFFYEVYGKKMMNAVNITEKSLKPYVDYSLDQYFLKDWDKGSVFVKGTWLIDTEMSYIILSQFLRQSPSIVAGLFNDLEHTDIESFKHKVFKGGTVCKIRFIASKARTLGTVSNRCCAFAAHSGTGVGSWSGFLEDFLEPVNTLDEFRLVLPCKFDEHGLLSKCPLYDDTKFRMDNGSESRNIPCPLLTADMKTAEDKLDRDRNKIGKLFYDLTEDIISKGGTKYKHKI